MKDVKQLALLLLSYIKKSYWWNKKMHEPINTFCSAFSMQDFRYLNKNGLSDSFF